MAVILGPIACVWLLAGCGRLGFSTEDLGNVGAHPDDDDGASEEAPQPDGEDDDGHVDEDPSGPVEPGPSDAGAVEPGDASTENPELDGSGAPPVDAGSDTPETMDAATPGPDGGMSEPDGGRRGPGRLDCGERNNSSTLVCASFDRDFPERSTARTNNGSIQVDQERLEAQTSKEEGSAALDIRFDAQDAGNLYLSAWFKLPDDFALTAANIVGFQASSGSDPSVDVNLIEGGKFEIFAPQAKLTEVAADFAVARGQWLCMKARILLSSSAGEIDLSVDGSPLFALRNVDTLPAVGVDQLSVGFDWTGATQAPARILFDNVLLSTKEISGDCP